jgi:hypothetical protein
MRMSRERIFYLADRILAELQATDGVASLKEVEPLRMEIVRTLTEESKLEESIGQEVRRIISTYARPPIEGSGEWEILAQKTREEVYKKRFRV